MSLGEKTRRRLAQRALARQLAYQQRKAEHVRGREEEVISAMMRSSRRVREILEAFQPIASDARVIEVGSGAHGLIFYFGSQHGIGVDPLAVSYRSLFHAGRAVLRLSLLPANRYRFPIKALML